MTTSPLPDHVFIEQFEQCNLDPVHFDHIGHIRLAWLYVKQNQESIAIDKMCRGIKAYASSLGATDKFHMTITQSLTKLIALREHKTKALDWPQFIEINKDLADDSIGLLLKHYSKAQLFSDLARDQFIEPDIAAF